MITPRLRSVTDCVKGNTVADIGTDHAYIPIQLIKEKRADRVIASDIKDGPVNAAKRTVLKYGAENKIEIRKGPGLSILEKGEADTIIIAGMGGLLIEEIIKADKEKINGATLILQPMNGQYELRKYLIDNGFEILKEDISVEGFKVYNLFIVKEGSGKKFEKDIYYHLPPYLEKNKNFTALYKKKEREFTKVIKGLENSKETDFEKLEIYKNWYKELKNGENYEIRKNS